MISALQWHVCTTQDSCYDVFIALGATVRILVTYAFDPSLIYKQVQRISLQSSFLIRLAQERDPKIHIVLCYPCNILPTFLYDNPSRIDSAAALSFSAWCYYMHTLLSVAIMPLLKQDDKYMAHGQLLLSVHQSAEPLERLLAVTKLSITMLTDLLRRSADAEVSWTVCPSNCLQLVDTFT
jgi:hypothetical protein